MALSALINALYETNMVIIVRRVYQANGAVRLGSLAPNIKKNYEVSQTFVVINNMEASNVIVLLLIKHFYAEIGCLSSYILLFS